jgi:hypothetical protein
LSFICEEIIVFYIFHHGGSTERQLYDDLRAITDWQTSKFLIYFDSSCIVITRSRKLARVITSKSVVKNSVLPTAAIILILVRCVGIVRTQVRFLQDGRIKCLWNEIFASFYCFIKRYRSNDEEWRLQFIRISSHSQVIALSIFWVVASQAWLQIMAITRKSDILVTV